MRRIPPIIVPYTPAMPPRNSSGAPQKMVPMIIPCIAPRRKKCPEDIEIMRFIIKSDNAIIRKIGIDLINIPRSLLRLGQHRQITIYFGMFYSPCFTLHISNKISHGFCGKIPQSYD